VLDASFRAKNRASKKNEETKNKNLSRKRKPLLGLPAFARHAEQGLKNSSNPP
jgi:hypothetical protein